MKYKVGDRFKYKNSEFKIVSIKDFSGQYTLKCKDNNDFVANDTWFEENKNLVEFISDKFTKWLESEDV